ncbi:MAG: hypothetical protein QXE17_00250, partial [Nitrososphaerota archaeon]
MKKDERKLIVMKTVRLPPKRIDERSSEVIESIMFWIVEEGFDGVVFDRCFCGSDCGYHSTYYLKCGHSDIEGHFVKVYNDYCPACLSKKLDYI